MKSAFLQVKRLQMKSVKTTLPHHFPDAREVLTAGHLESLISGSVHTPTSEQEPSVTAGKPDLQRMCGANDNLSYAHKWVHKEYFKRLITWPNLKIKCINSNSNHVDSSS